MQMVPTVLVADPPWLMRDHLPGATRGASKQYKCLPLDKIALFDLPLAVRTAPNAVLFLWRLSSMLEEALVVARAWGFRPHSELVWQKLTSGGKAHFGMGRILRGSHEACLIATRGKAPPAVRNVRSVFEAPVGAHSEKPDAFYDLVTTLYPRSPRYELFARRVRPGWQQHGKELGKLG